MTRKRIITGATLIVLLLVSLPVISEFILSASVLNHRPVVHAGDDLSYVEDIGTRILHERVLLKLFCGSVIDSFGVNSG